MTSPFNQSAYLRTTRTFPTDSDSLSRELDKSYLDTAAAVNERTIGLYPTTKPAITGNSWFVSGNKKQQSLRQVYSFTTTTAINHGITVIEPGQFLNCYGSYTNGTDSFGLPFATSVAVAGLITFYVTSTQIVFMVGAGAPALTSGKIVLEWLSQA
jgi:hypothetical protein